MSKFLIKPVIASIIMAVCSYFTYIKLYLLIPQKFLLIVSLLIGIIVYIISIFIFKILSEEEIFMIPYGQKMYKRVKKDKNKIS